MKSTQLFLKLRIRNLFFVLAVTGCLIFVQACGGSGDQAVTAAKLAAPQVSDGCSSLLPTRGLAVGDLNQKSDWDNKRVISAFLLSADQRGNIVKTDLKGNIISDSVFKTAVRNLPKDGVSAIELRITDEVALSTLTQDQLQTDWEVKKSLGCYFIRISWEKHLVKGCINKDVWHLGLILKNTCSNRDILNAHACVWWQNGPQFGLYDSFSGWCATTVGTFTAIRDKLKVVLAVVGITGFTAYVISTFGASVIVAAFAI